MENVGFVPLNNLERSPWKRNPFQHRRGSIPRQIVSVGVADSTFTNLHKPLHPSPKRVYLPGDGSFVPDEGGSPDLTSISP